MQAKSIPVIQLEKQVYAFNNKAQYENSLQTILDFLNTPSISNEDAYYANSFLADTYKRIFDYDNVLLYLERAQACAEKITKNQQFYLDDVNCQRAFALFDIQNYQEARIVMEELAINGYVNLSVNAQAMLMMQKAYLLYLDRHYFQAERQYDLAIKKMHLANSCDLPLIYGKKIALYGAMQDEPKMLSSYKQAVHFADSCHITKYNLYAAEIMRNTYQSMGKYDMAFKYFTVYDSLNTIYNADGFKNKLQELEFKYESSKKEQDLFLKEQTIIGNKRLIALLAIAVGTLVLMIALYITIQRRRKLVKEKSQWQLFTKQLLTKTENERKRIATDLHDSVNNDLLLIKSSMQKNTPEEIETKIDALMNQVRAISRNLHPVMFEELGLQDSVEQLVKRVQEHNHFILNTEIDYDGCLNSTDELQLYRIIQEAVNNMIKYAKAQAGIITISQLKEKLLVEIKDNGTGFNVLLTLASKSSFGLHNIIERSTAINGHATITSNQHGTLIHIEIPIKK